MRVSESAFGDPEVVYSNAKAKEITYCNSDKEMSELLLRTYFYSNIFDHLDKFSNNAIEEPV